MTHVKLFEMDSLRPLLPRASLNVIKTPDCGRCVPAKLRIPLAVAEHFVITEIRAGVEPLLATTEGGVSSKTWADGIGAVVPPFKAVYLEVGMQFAIGITNTSEEPQTFKCEVWGELLEPLRV